MGLWIKSSSFKPQICHYCVSLDKLFKFYFFICLFKINRLVVIYQIISKSKIIWLSPWTHLIRKSLYLCQYNILFYFFQHPQTSFSYILTTYRYFSAYGNPTAECHYQTMFKSGNGFNICSLSKKVKKIVCGPTSGPGLIPT